LCKLDRFITNTLFFYYYGMVQLSKNFGLFDPNKFLELNNSLYCKLDPFISKGYFFPLLSTVYQTTFGPNIWAKHLGQTFGPNIWAKHLGQTFGPNIRAKHLGQPFGPNIWAKHLGQTFGPNIRAKHLGQTFGPNLWAKIFVELTIEADSIKPFWR
jgi:hypothetical protein